MSCKDLGAVTEMGKPRLLHAMSIRADIGPAIEFATSQGTTRAIFPIEGGVVQGDGLTGRILPGGADFARLLPDGSYAIEARYCIKFDEGTTVMILNAGRMFPQPDGTYQGRTRAEFEAPYGPYAWLADEVFYGTALSEAEDEARVFIELWQAVV